MESEFAGLPSSLEARAFRWGAESAWDKATALTVLRWATEKGLRLTGIEVWIAADNGPIVAGYFWRPNKASDMKSCFEEGSHFVSDFAWGAHDADFRHSAPLFNMAFAMS